jgi:hypothetical protein
MDDATFKVFWEMSEPDSPARHCFLRQPQLEYFVEKKTAEENCLVTMPNVSSDYAAGLRVPESEPRSGSELNLVFLSANSVS